jgi:hypothetical protein
MATQLSVAQNVAVIIPRAVIPRGIQINSLRHCHYIRKVNNMRKNKLSRINPVYKTIRKDLGQGLIIPDIECDRVDAGGIIVIFNITFDPRSLTQTFVKDTLFYFMDNLTIDEVGEAMCIACDKFRFYGMGTAENEELRDLSEQAIKYFCGICWNLIRLHRPQTEVIVTKEGK